jgi:Putative prokaryotic signal transducing protein
MPESFITVATFEKAAEAQLARNQLAEEGIDAFLEGAETAVMFVSPGGVKLQVATDDELRARAILGQRRKWPEKPVHDDYGLDKEVSKTAIRGRRFEPGRDDDSQDKVTSKTGIRARPFDVDDEDEELPESAADATARRAWRSAVIGLLIFPPILHVYSLWQLLQIPAEEGPLSDVGKRSLCLAVALDAAVFGTMALIWIGLVRGLIR